MRVGGAIVLDALAFVVWNVASRTPVRMLADMRAAAGDGRRLVGGIVAFAVGVIFTCSAALLMLPALPDAPHEFAVFELGTLLAGLALDMVLGDDLRALVAGRRTS